MKKLELKKRELLGKKAKRVTHDNMIPAVVYNSKGDSTPVKASQSDVIKLLADATSTTIIEIDLDGKKSQAIIKEVETHPITDHIRHISLFEVDDTAAMVFSLPFTLTGISPAVKNNLGVLVQVSQSLDVKAKPSAIVPEIKIDINNLEKPGMTVSVKDITLPEGIELIREEDAEIAIVTVTKIQKATVVEEEEETDGEEGEEDAGEEATEEA